LEELHGVGADIRIDRPAEFEGKKSEGPTAGKLQDLSETPIHR
jgi:hypothetical protein